jgi:hypothetical protein
LRRPETEVDVATIESTTEIRPFSVEVPEEDLVDLAAGAVTARGVSSATNQ